MEFKGADCSGVEKGSEDEVGAGGDDECLEFGGEALGEDVAWMSSVNWQPLYNICPKLTYPSGAQDYNASAVAFAGVEAFKAECSSSAT